jgi:hypothetical protein
MTVRSSDSRESEMRNMRMAALVIGALLTLPATGLAAPAASATLPDTRGFEVSSARHERIHEAKGIVRSVDSTRLVISQWPGEGQRMTFALNPETERFGILSRGSMVDVHYWTEAKARIATTVIVEHAKEMPLTSGSHQ